MLRAVGRLAVCAASLMLAYAPAARADQLEQHNELVNKFITEMHADPLVADCAAHGNFVAGTSTALDHVEFPPAMFDSDHATITPWDDSFDNRKQRIKVDKIVTVDGIGIPQKSDAEPYDLKFRCGYVGTQMLAFSWNDPVPPLRAQHSTARGHGKHTSKKRKKAAGGGAKKAVKKKTR